MAPQLPGIVHLPGYLDEDKQRNLLGEIRQIVKLAPLFVPCMPGTGKPMSVRMTNCGPLGWVTDKEQGYRYQKLHPISHKPWPAIPEMLLDIWSEISGCIFSPEACLINYYDPVAKMGLHQDRDEKEFSAPVVSISLGDECLFRVGGPRRNDPTSSFRLKSGDGVVLSDEARLCYHGVDRIYPGTSNLLKQPGRINLTLRRVTKFAEPVSR